MGARHSLNLSEVPHRLDIYFVVLSQHCSALIQYIPVGGKHSPFMALSLGLWQHTLASSHFHALHSILCASLSLPLQVVPLCVTTLLTHLCIHFLFTLLCVQSTYQ